MRTVRTTFPVLSSTSSIRLGWVNRAYATSSSQNSQTGRTARSPVFRALAPGAAVPASRMRVFAASGFGSPNRTAGPSSPCGFSARSAIAFAFSRVIASAGSARSESPIPARANTRTTRRMCSFTTRVRREQACLDCRR